VTPDAGKSPDRIEQEMEQTRESISAKVAALESQVLGTIQSAANTLTDTVQTVKDTVTTAPAVVKDTVQETVAAVKESFSSVCESVTSFSVSECVSRNPVAALGTSLAGGFLTGYLLFGNRDARPVMARGRDEPVPDGRPGAMSHGFIPFGGGSVGSTQPARSGLLAGVMAMVGGELEQLAKQALSTAVASLKKSVNEKVPLLMDEAVQNLAHRVTGQNGAADTNGTRTAANSPTATPVGGY
jgi:ElaB/YqjD/DUF883 family membrane-anchored ribosome-binding protein